MSVEKIQQWVLYASILCVTLGLLSSFGCTLVPKGPTGAAWVLHPLLVCLGAAGGLAAHLRGREIDRRRWQLVEDPTLTSGEREYAHHEAERQRRIATNIFMAGPVALGYWMAYLFNAEDRLTAADFLIVSPLLGFLLGLLGGGRLAREVENPLGKG